MQRFHVSFDECDYYKTIRESFLENENDIFFKGRICISFNEI